MTIDRIHVAHVGCGGNLAVEAVQPILGQVLMPGMDVFRRELEPFFQIRCLRCGLTGRRLG